MANLQMPEPSSYSSLELHANTTVRLVFRPRVGVGGAFCLPICPCLFLAIDFEAQEHGHFGATDSQTSSSGDS